MKKLILVSVCVALVAFFGTQPAGADTYPLIAGQFYPVGEVTITNDADNLYVVYSLSEDCEEIGILETHVHVGESLDDFPLTNKGLPKIGNFDYSGAEPPSYTIPLGDMELPLLVGVHGVVGSSFLEDLLDLGCVDPIYCFPGPDDVKCAGVDAYFSVDLEGEIYEAWCADGDHGLGHNQGYPLDLDCSIVYSTLETIPDWIQGGYGDTGGIDNPANLDLVNWILNQDYPGQGFTVGEVQLAIWRLLDGEPVQEALNSLANTHIGGYTEANVQQIIDEAIAGGDGFVPGCCEVVGVILVPPPVGGGDPAEALDENLRQLVMLVVPAPCDETIWGQGPLFTQRSNDKGKRQGSWAMYCEYPKPVPVSD